MSGKRKQSKNKPRSTNELRDRPVYAVAILALTALVCMAFYSPGWIFGLQDRRQCSDMVLEERENVDVAVLSTNYESSFYQRMINFAEDQSENTNYYVASEELTDYGELRDFLDSEAGLYSDSINLLFDIQLITRHIYNYKISAWKQYVIYSDDYAKGVNFILWYIELEHPDEAIGTYKLLLEANTGELYGLKADMGGTLFQSGMTYDRNKIYYDYSLEDYFGSTATEVLDEAWMMLAYFYSGLTESDFLQFYEMYYSAIGAMYNDKTAIVKGDTDMTAKNAAMLAELKLGTEEEENEWIDFLQTYPATMLVWDDGNRLECNFPYGSSSLVFRLQMEKSVPHPWTLRNITIGFPAIYELIPEFG